MTTTYKPLFSGYATAYTVTAGNSVVFTPDIVSVPCSGVTFDGAGVQLCRKGFYLVSFNGFIDADTAGAVSMSLLKNGVAVAGATSSGTAAAAGDAVPMAVTKLVYVAKTTCPIADTPDEYSVSVETNSGAVTGTLTVVKVY